MVASDRASSGSRDSSILRECEEASSTHDRARQNQRSRVAGGLRREITQRSPAEIPQVSCGSDAEFISLAPNASPDYFSMSASGRNESPGEALEFRVPSQTPLVPWSSGPEFGAFAACSESNYDFDVDWSSFQSASAHAGCFDTMNSHQHPERADIGRRTDSTRVEPHDDPMSLYSSGEGSSRGTGGTNDCNSLSGEPWYNPYPVSLAAVGRLSNDDPSDSTLSLKESEKNVSYCMERLSELNATLNRLVGSYSCEIPGSGGSPAAHGLEEVAAGVLESSSNFLDLLAALHPLVSPQIGTATMQTPVMQPSNRDANFPTTSSYPSPSSMKSSASPRYTGIILKGSFSNSERRSPCPSTMREDETVKKGRLPMLDTAAKLQLLICYIRSTNLHFTLYEIIRHRLLMPDQRPHGNTGLSLERLSPLRPLLQMGGISIASSGRFQLKILLQIAVHGLGQIEMALGLPQAFRVSRIEACEGVNEGILGSSGDAQLLQTVMRGTSADQNQVQAIRSVLGELKPELSGSIDI